MGRNIRIGGDCKDGSPLNENRYMLFEDFSIDNVARIIRQKKRSATTQNNTDILSFIMGAQPQRYAEGLNSPMTFHRVYGNQNHDLW